MSLKCLECGNIFDECEMAEWTEPHGEMMSGCPCCGGAYEETQKCKICGGEFLYEELLGRNVCQECFDEYKNDFEICFSLGERSKVEVEINSCLLSILGVTKIEAIIYNYIKDKMPDVDCASFVAIDEDWFAENLPKEVKKWEQEKDLKSFELTIY